MPSEEMTATITLEDGTSFVVSPEKITPRSFFFAAPQPLAFQQKLAVSLLDASISAEVAFINDQNGTLVVFDHSDAVQNALDRTGAEADESEKAEDEPWSEATEQPDELASVDLDIDFDDKAHAEKAADQPWDESTAATPFSETTHLDDLPEQERIDSLAPPAGESKNHNPQVDDLQSTVEAFGIEMEPPEEASVEEAAGGASDGDVLATDVPASVPPAEEAPAADVLETEVPVSEPPEAAAPEESQANAKSEPPAPTKKDASLPELEGANLRFSSAEHFRTQWDSNIVHGGIVASSAPLPVGSQRVVKFSIAGVDESVEFSVRVGFLGAGTVGFMIDSFPRLKPELEAFKNRLN